jgi:hypothetical protein
MAALWATNSTGVAIGYFAGDAASTVLFALCAFLALREVGGRFEALGGDRVLGGTGAPQVPGALREAFDLLSSISAQQRLAAVHEVAGNNVTEPQGLYSVLALQEAEAERQRRRQRRAQGS